MIRQWPYLHDLSTAPTAQHLHIPYFSAYSLPRITVNSKLKIKPNSINITIVVFKVQCPLTVKLHSQCYGLMHPGKLLAVASQCTVCHKVRIHILWGGYTHVECNRESYDKRTNGQRSITAHSSLPTDFKATYARKNFKSQCYSYLYIFSILQYIPQKHVY